MIKYAPLISFTERYILPLIFLFQTAKGVLKLSNSELNSLILLNDILKPLLFSVLLFLSSKTSARILNFKIIAGLFLSYLPFYFFEVTLVKGTTLLNSLYYACLIYYLLLLSVGLLNLGKSFTIVPAFVETKTTGLFKILKHPIYSAYLHFFLTFVLINFTTKNIVLFILFFMGILLRSVAEEENLRSFDVDYDTKMKGKNRFFSLYFSLPCILLILLKLYSLFPKSSEKILINMSYPIYSLIPFKADDWSSFFVMNHIYGRILEGKGEFRSNSIVSDMSVTCSEESLTVLSPDCKRVKIRGFLKKDLKLCRGQAYTVEDFNNELNQISDNKSWILPNLELCNENDICFEFDNVKNIQNNLGSIYLRFGWSRNNSNDEVFGIAPNCFYPSGDKTDVHNSGVLKLSDRILDLTTKPHVGDIFLYGSEPSSPNLKKISFYNPIYYFLVLSGQAIESGLSFKDSELEVLRQKFRERGFTDKNDKVENFLLASNKSNLLQFSSRENNHIIAIPDYLEDCGGLAKELEISFKSKIKFECVNIATYVENTVKDSKNQWSGFISPLTPGMPGKDGMLTQYFSLNSSDSWLGKRSAEKSIVHQIGISNGHIQVSKKTFCSIRPNSLGLSDLTYDDFLKCD